MALVWLLIEVMFVFLYYQLPAVSEDIDVEPVDGDVLPYNSPLESIDESTPLITSTIAINNTEHDSSHSLAESKTLRVSIRLSSPPRPLEVSGSAENKGLCSRLLGVLSELLREEIVVLLTILFITMFGDTAFEAMLVPVAENVLNWSEQDLSILYSGAGVDTCPNCVCYSLSDE